MTPTQARLARDLLHAPTKADGMVFDDGTVLRAEKGFPIVGQDTDGTVTPYDLGMSWAVSKKKVDFIGKRSFTRTDTARPDRLHLCRDDHEPSYWILVRSSFARYLSAWLSDAALEYRTLRPGGTGQ